MAYTCISADCHIDLTWLPSDLFTSNASREMKSRMPYVTDTPDGPAWVSKRGAMFGLDCGVGPVGKKYLPGLVHRADRMAAEGLYDQHSRESRRLSNAAQRIKDQDRDGVQAEVLYGILGAAARLNDAEAATEMLRIYNEWLADFCKTFPNRLLGLGSMGGTSVSEAVDAVRRVAKLGLRGVEMAATAEMIPLVDRRWDPLWQAISDAGLPVHFHISGAFIPAWLNPALNPSHWSKQERRADFAVLISGSQFIAAQFLSSMIFGGVLERYPKVRVVLGESGIGWIPYMLDRMDYEWEDQFRNDLGLKLKPSEYWKRQCKASFQYDEVGVKLIDMLGADTLMWGSDFPHPDGVWPDSQEYIMKQFSHLPEQVRHKVICSNAMECYGLHS